jgi:hypothetical protein
MQDLPDADYIRDAEMNGFPSPDPVKCPICGDEAQTFYLQDGLVIGCEHCVSEVDADQGFLDR